MADLEIQADVRRHLTQDIIPFWKGLRDNENGGWYGWLGYDLRLDKKAVKGCILNSRITWFFANAYTLLGDESLLDEARHGYEFLKNCCWDKENGGVYWSVNYDGTPAETLKHTYNQAFSIYALSSYYEASGEKEALDMAYALYDLIEGRMRDALGYKEAFDKAFCEIDNEKLSENGVMAQKTMNTLLHVFEAYTELYRVDRSEKVAEKIKWMMDLFAEKIYRPALHRQEVFFDSEWHSIIDLHSYGHDIETAWLVDRSVAVLGDAGYEKKMTPITGDLTNQIYETAFNGGSLANECENGVVDEWRIWWVQAESVVGFLNGYEKTGRAEYLEAAQRIWHFIEDHVIDRREGASQKGREWYWRVRPDGTPDEEKPMVEPWKCPYHNGRMCFEVIRRAGDGR
ncbi:MAG: AGE family epimerase/isomerase [Roseburia sp.]|nr:AGE family epimerase/isomerase [Roseburia sp.]